MSPARPQCRRCKGFMALRDGKPVCTVCDGEVRPVQKLADAHQDADQRRPEQAAMPSQWMAFHRANARMYERVAEIDRGHHHEALYWAEREWRNVDQVEQAARIALPDRERKGVRHG